MADKAPKTTNSKKKASSSTSRRTSSSTTTTPYTSTKPLLGLGTIITLILFVAVVITAVLINRKKESDVANATPVGGETTYVFTEADGTPVSIKIEPFVGEAVQLERNAENAWELILPAKTEANQGMAEAAATQIGAIGIVTPEIKGNPADFGLDIPTHVITIKFTGGQTHTLEVGDSAITNNGYYVRLDKAEIMLVSLSAIDSLTQLVFFPPYLNTPTPTALPPTETPVPVLDTPTTALTEVTVTPTP